MPAAHNYHRRFDSCVSNPQSPLPLNRNNTQRSAYSTTTAATGATGISNTTFLPELHSTPPMPTFQKPTIAVGTPTSLRQTDIMDYGEATTPTRSAAAQHPPRSSSLDYSGPTRARPGAVSPAYQRSATPITRALYTTVNLEDRLPPIESLPSGWRYIHDRAICILDARGHDAYDVVKRVKQSFPELKGSLTAEMIFKRLLILDENVNIPYWKIGLPTLTDAQKEEYDRLSRKILQNQSSTLNEPTASARHPGLLPNPQTGLRVKPGLGLDRISSVKDLKDSIDEMQEDELYELEMLSAKRKLRNIEQKEKEKENVAQATHLPARLPVSRYSTSRESSRNRVQTRPFGESGFISSLS